MKKLKSWGTLIVFLIIVTALLPSIGLIAKIAYKAVLFGWNLI